MKEAILTLDEFIKSLIQELQSLEIQALPDRRARVMPDVRTIRYYNSLGLLAPPIIRERKAHYGPEHREQVLLIKFMQYQGLSLQEIQKQIYGLSRVARQNLLQRYRPQSNPTPQAVSWQEYPILPGVRLQLNADFKPEYSEKALNEIKKIFSYLKESRHDKND